MTISREHDVNTDRFTVLAAYLSGWEIERDIFSAKADVYRHRHSIRNWKKYPSPKSDEYIKEDECKLKVSKRLAFLFTKYIDSIKGGRSLSLKEDKELFNLYYSKHSYSSPNSINVGRNEVRAMLTYLTDIKSYVQDNHQYVHEKIKQDKWFSKCRTDDFLEYSEQLCVKCLERPNELTKEEERWANELGRAIQVVMLQWKPETRTFYSKFWDSFDAAQASDERRKSSDEPDTWKEDKLKKDLEETHELDVRTDKFTELADVFYGFFEIGNDIDYLMQLEIESGDRTTHEQEKARLIYLLNEFKKSKDTGMPFDGNDDRELFNLYTTHINRRSPKSINEERDRIRAIFILSRRMSDCDEYKIKWDLCGEKGVASDCVSDLRIMCDALLNRPKEVTAHYYKTFKVLFNLIALMAETISEYNECWKEYINTDGVHRRFAVHIDTIDNIILRSRENDLNTDSFTKLTGYLYEYQPMRQHIRYIKYLIQLDLGFIKYYKMHPEMQSNNCGYINIIYSMLKEKRRYFSLLHLYVKDREKGKPVSEKHDKELCRFHMSYRKQADVKTIEEDRDIFRANLILISDIGNSIAAGQLIWKSKYAKDRLAHYLNFFMMVCITYLEHPNKAGVIDYMQNNRLAEFIINIARTRPPLKKHWLKYKKTLNDIHNRYHSRKDKIITMNPEHDVKTYRFTELAEYFYGFDKQEDALQYFTYLLTEDERERDYYKENPDKQNAKHRLDALEFNIEGRKPLVLLMAKYMKGRKLTLKEDRKLYQLYIEHRAIASPMEINRERERNRKLLASIASMKNYVLYAASDLAALERLCIKLLERPKEVTSPEYSEFTRLRDNLFVPR
ncbi:MAG: hypothetical protein HQK96_14895 [Nitrospirae bacterium]|nr:hypothetical protein [Nitrospirota bacterium]